MRRCVGSRRRERGAGHRQGEGAGRGVGAWRGSSGGQGGGQSEDGRADAPEDKANPVELPVAVAAPRRLAPARSSPATPPPPARLTFPWISTRTSSADGWGRGGEERRGRGAATAEERPAALLLSGSLRPRGCAPGTEVGAGGAGGEEGPEGREIGRRR
jgi:hypothetical protein